MKKIVVLLLLVLLIATPPPAMAAGIPTMDISNIIAMALDYITQIFKYQEQITQSITEAAQLAQMVKEYMQTLREYEQYLNQVMSLKNKISNGDWRSLMNILAYYTGHADLWRLIDSFPNASFEQDMDAILSLYGYVPKDPKEVEAAAKRLGLWTEQYAEQVKQEWNQFELFKDRFRMIAQVAEASKKRTEVTIPKHADILRNLGDESDLATLQAMAFQNQTMMGQLESLIQLQNASLYTQESEQARRAAKSAQWKERERERLSNREVYKSTNQTRLADF